MNEEIPDTFHKRILHGLKESEFRELGLSRNPFIPFIPKEIRSTFVNRENEKKLLVRYLPELVQGFIPLLIIGGSKGIGKTHFFNYIYDELKEIEKDLGHEVICLDIDNIKDFSNKIKIGEITKPQLVFIDDTEKVWDKYKQEFVELIESHQHITKFICVWNQSKWSQIKNDNFYASLKPVCIKIEKLSKEHLIKIIKMRINQFIIGKNQPFTEDSLEVLADYADGIPYSMVYFSEKLLHFALDKNVKVIDKLLTEEFIKTLQSKKFNFTSITPSQWRVLRALMTITHSKKRGATSSEIADEMTITRPAAIMHLRELKFKNMIEEKIEEKRKYYYIRPMILGQVELYLSEGEE